MRRLHIHIGVEDIDTSIRFYTSMFAAEPVVTKDDYAKWLLEDPQVNFAISKANGEGRGIHHLGFQTEDEEGLKAIAGRLKEAGEEVAPQRGAACCYAISDKAWVNDPQGVVWENFHTTGESETFGDDLPADASDVAGVEKKDCC